MGKNLSILQYLSIITWIIVIDRTSNLRLPEIKKYEIGQFYQQAPTTTCIFNNIFKMYPK